jgi:hypothetical protein
VGLMMISLFYHKGKKNLGDIVNVNIFRDILGFDVKYSKEHKADFLGIGSVLGRAFIYNNPKKNALKNFLKNKKKYLLRIFGAKPINIWGSGFIQDDTNNIKDYRKINILALRGKYSKKILEKHLCVDLSDIALGDPGLLVNRLVKENKNKKYKLGVIPHYIDAENELIDKLVSENQGAIKINILGDPIETLNAINECEAIVSTAMHGLIAADSLNIPNKWIEVSDGVIGGGFKYRDYYSVFDIEPKVLDLRNEVNFKIDLDKLKSEYKITKEMVEEVNQNLLRAIKKES